MRRTVPLLPGTLLVTVAIVPPPAAVARSAAPVSPVLAAQLAGNVGTLPVYTTALDKGTGLVDAYAAARRLGAAAA
jgi:hypothetical protein